MIPVCYHAIPRYFVALLLSMTTTITLTGYLPLRTPVQQGARAAGCYNDGCPDRPGNPWRS